jgi:peptide/nickel transport system permease protein
MTTTTVRPNQSIWAHAARSIYKDKLAFISFVIVTVYMVMGILAFTGVIAADWSKEIGPSYSAPSADYIFGTDIFGRSVFLKAIKGAETAISIGLVTAFITVTLGSVLGLIAGYYGGKLDDFIAWIYTTISSIPGIMLIIAIAFIIGKGLTAVYLSLGLTSWVGLCRVIRGEVIRHKDREYVHAASAIGGSDMRKMFRHILPNVSHMMIINFSLTFQMAIKSEVILSYLGLGVQGRPSWGVMIDDAKLELSRGVWWQLGAATLFMFIIVLALNILGDAIRDALDPKLKGK